MSDRYVASVRVLGGDRLEVTLHPGFTDADFRLIKSLAGRRWDARRRVWTVPGAEHALSTFEQAWEKHRVRVVGGVVPEDRSAWTEQLLEPATR